MWSVAEIPDQTGRVVLVTGASGGLGLECTRALAARGAHVLMAVRDLSRGEAAARHVTGSTELVHVDLASLESVRECVAGLAGRPIDVLLNNAGIMAVPKATSVDGHELHLATNVLGPFALTAGLLGQLRDRVVWVSSLMHRMGRISLADPSWRHRRYQPWAAYGSSKLADLMLAYEMQRRLTLAGSSVRSYAAHPGYAQTDLQRHAGWMALPIARQAQSLLRMAQDAESGAWPLLYAATAPDLSPGCYVGPSGRGELTGPPRVVGSSAASHDRETQRALWSLCEALSGVKAGLPG